MTYIANNLGIQMDPGNGPQCFSFPSFVLSIRLLEEIRGRPDGDIIIQGSVGTETRNSYRTCSSQFAVMNMMQVLFLRTVHSYRTSPRALYLMMTAEQGRG